MRKKSHQLLHSGRLSLSLNAKSGPVSSRFLALLIRPVRGLRDIYHSNRFPLLLLTSLLLINVTFIVAHVWQRGRQSSQKTVAVVLPQVAFSPLHPKDELSDHQWTSVLVRPFHGVYVLIGVVPVLLIVGSLCKNPNQHRSTMLAYGFVCILMWVTLFTVNHAMDEIASNALTEKAYAQFQKRIDIKLGMELYSSIPGAIGAGLFFKGLTMRTPRGLSKRGLRR